MAVNFAGDVDPVSITLDCQVQGDYTVTLLSGEKGDENSFEEPEKVKNITVNMHGASSEFVYEAPPYSVSALRLKKVRRESKFPSEAHHQHTGESVFRPFHIQSGDILPVLLK